MNKNKFKNKKVLLMGLGILGGGVNIANWLISQGAILTITDLKKRSQLKESILKLKNKDKQKFVLGKHRKEDFINNEIIVLNQDIQLNNPFLKIAEENNKQIEDELTLFYKNSPSKNIIATTGTRGKTTTSNWIAHLLRKKFKGIKPIGNSPENSLIGNINKIKKGKPVIIECPSCILEQVNRVKFSPKIAVITNIYRDHLNRHNGEIREYALTKSNVFLNQSKSDFLILNYKNKWTNFFIKMKPRAKILFFSTSNLPAQLNGIFVKKGEMFFRENGKEKFIFHTKKFVEKWGSHNLENILPAILVSLKNRISISDIVRGIDEIPQIKFRQELVFNNGRLKIYNDTASTSPEAGISAIKRFSNNGGGDKVVLITGGTDKDLDYSEWAKYLKKYFKTENVVFLSGSATDKMKKEVEWKKVIEFDSLKECFDKAIRIASESNSATIIFSPGSKSFEKFNNEFDRGEQFNNLVNKLSI